MARMYPNHLAISEKVSSAEYNLYRQLRDQLDNSYVVFHSVAWQAKGRNGRPIDGETDFVIAHPENGILVMEVKGGNIKFEPLTGTWTSTSEGNREYTVKDPFGQAKVAKYTLLELLKLNLPRVNHINIGHAVAFPDVFVGHEPLGADKPSELILDMGGTADLSAWVGQALAYWRGQNTRKESAPGRHAMSALMQLLGRTRELRPALWGEIKREQAEMIQLTEEQFVLLDMLGRQRRAAVSGCAGAGKTLLAVEKAVRLAKQGYKVLLTCYNKNLNAFLQSRVGDVPNLDIRNFHKLCFDIAREGNALPINTHNKNRFYAHLLPEAMMDAAEELNIRYDAIIVDEGQDFNEAWWLPLQTLLNDPDDGILYIFYDDNQQIYGKSKGRDVASTFPIETLPYTLTINCRNTRQIHKQVSRFYRADNATTARGPAGRPVSVARYSEDGKLHATLSDTIRKLTRDEHIPPSEIAILTPLSRRNSHLWIGDGFRGVNYSEQWPAAPEHIHCNTIQSFKGLESTVVILAEIGSVSDRAKDLDPLLYVACSRAKNHLIVLLPDNAPPVLQRRFA